MALSLLRRCSKLNSAVYFLRLVPNQNVVPNRFCKARLRGSLAEGRFYSSQRKHKVVAFIFPKPIKWFRTQIYCFLIRAYFDKDFSVKEFTEGATQAFFCVSGLLSRCQFEALEGLVAEDLIRKLEEKCSSLPSNDKEALSADPDNIVHTNVSGIRIYYEGERKFVRILMHFCYMTNASLPDINPPATRLTKIATDDSSEDVATEKFLHAIYEFQREFTQGAPSDWTITRMQHSKFLQ